MKTKEELRSEMLKAIAKYEGRLDAIAYLSMASAVTEIAIDYTEKALQKYYMDCIYDPTDGSQRETSIQISKWVKDNFSHPQKEGK